MGDAVGNLLKKGSAWLERKRSHHCASPVEYRRPPDAKHVRATYGRTRYELSDEAGLTIEAQSWDFLVLAAELGFTPEPGDSIVTGGRRYEVMSLGGEGCWRWSDPYRETYRIHTKDVGEE